MPELPTGTITFLFTDIEASTQHWERFPDAMRQALARHDVLVRQAILDHGGQVVKMRGDGFHAAFASAPAAVAAMFEAQRALNREEWPERIHLRARMAAHTGEAQLRDGDYYGSVVNRAARLLDIAHGGQTLVSGVAHGLIVGDLPPQVTLKDLGLHRLKDLLQPEPVFQLLHPDLPSEFPPLKSLDTIRTNLPIQVTSFIGREEERETARRLLSTTRLLTLVGTGGAGKTRLSLEVGADLLDEFSDGVWLVELAALADPALVPQTVAQVLSVREQSGRAITDILKDHLRTRRLLLILDNCEHLLEACARLADTLLHACDHLKILASSREGLRIGAEQTYRVPSLPTPDPTRLPTEEKDLAGVLLEYSAVELFVERARHHRSDFKLTHRNAAAVAAICHRLDGIPLGIELAAARVRSLSVEEIGKRLDQRFRLLTGGSRTALPRQQTLRALIDWSYDLLTEGERRLLARLSVFAGGWTLEAAEAVCGDASSLTTEDTEGHRGTASPQHPIPNTQHPFDVLDLLTSLVDKNLVVFEERGDQERYRHLETVREYAAEKLRDAGETDMARQRHMGWYLRLAEQAEPKLSGPEQEDWLDRLEAERDNLRFAIEMGAGEAGLRLAATLGRFWEMRSYHSEGRALLALAMKAANGVATTKTRARALTAAGILAWRQSDLLSARTLLDESLPLMRSLGDGYGIATALNCLGNIARGQSDYTSARALFEESLALRREIGDLSGVASSLNNLASIASDLGDPKAAQALFEESLALRRTVGDRWGIAMALNNLGNTLIEQREYETARKLLEESLALGQKLGDSGLTALSLHNLANIAFCQNSNETARTLFEQSLVMRRGLGNKWGIAMSLNALGQIAVLEGDYRRAREIYEEGLAINREIGDLRGMVYYLEAFATLCSEQGQGTRAAQLWGAVASAREAIQSPLSDMDHQIREQQAAGVREAIGAEAFQAAWNQGLAMPLEQAVVYALNAVAR
jgi:predicted ATPase/class 3 adenylate cyclase/Tfp pilus assembly protein PilF